MNPGISYDTVFSGSERYPFSHGSTLAETREGDILVAWYAGSREKGRDVVILTARRSADGGRWTEPTVAADAEGKPKGNPVLHATDSGMIMLFHQTIHVTSEGPTTLNSGWTTCDIECRESRDHGRSWGPDAPVREEWGYVTRAKPLVVDGRLLLPVHDERKWASLVMITEGTGRAWRESNLVDAREGFKRGNIEPALVELSDGRLLMYMRSGARRWIWQSASVDRGLSWSEPVPTTLPNPDSAVDLLRLRNGHILLAFDDSSHARTPLTLALSTDDCASWCKSRGLESGPGSFSYPAMIQSRDGLVHVSYTCNGQAIKHVQLDEEWLASGV